MSTKKTANARPWFGSDVHIARDPGLHTSTAPMSADPIVSAGPPQSSLRPMRTPSRSLPVTIVDRPDTAGLDSLVCLLEELMERVIDLETEVALVERERDEALSARAASELQREEAVMLGLEVADQRDGLARQRDALIRRVETLERQVAGLGQPQPAARVALPSASFSGALH